MKAYEACGLCPRQCGADRNAGQEGYCGETGELRLASACLHFGEEPPLVGFGGSGTVFVSGCNAGCLFCQNHQISRGGMGRAVSREEFVDVCLALQDAGALNVNIVTGSHAIPFLADALQAAKTAGLSIPVCWNTSSYENRRALEIIAPHIDIWLPDLKTLDPRLSESVFAAPDYPQTALRAISFMIERSPLVYARESSACQPHLLGGVIVRHLFLPGRFADTERALRWLKEHADGKALVSLMTQYTPVMRGTKGERKKLYEDRFVSSREAADLRRLAEALDFDTLFFQELDAGDEWLPDFSRVQPFSNALAKPVWHWTCGFTDGAHRTIT